MLNFFKSKKSPVVKELSIEDMSQIRDMREKLAGIKLGNAFGLETREGIRIFKLIEIRKGKT